LEPKEPFDPTKHLIDFRGKMYLPVAARLAWMREEHPSDWGIETEIVRLEMDPKHAYAVMRCTVRDGRGMILAQATKVEYARNFPDYTEKCETGCVGRALAMCGYGTQYVPDLEEGERVVDSPQEHRGGRGRRGGGQAQGEAAGPLVCSVPGCGVILTRGQAGFSEKSFGRRLCPHHQKEARDQEGGPDAE
jgi:hypothetical protein